MILTIYLIITTITFILLTIMLYDTYNEGDDIDLSDILISIIFTFTPLLNIAIMIFAIVELINFKSLLKKTIIKGKKKS